MQFYKFSVPVGGTFTIAAQGSYVRYYKNTAGSSAPTVEIRTDKGEAILLRTNESGRSNRPFTQLTVTNFDASVQIDGIFQIGDGEIEQNTFNGDVSGSSVLLTQGSTVTNLAELTVGVAEVSAHAAATSRKSIRWRAPATNTQNIYLGATGITTANGCIELKPGDSWIEVEGANAAWFAIAGGAGQALRRQEIS
jgi:hypothetical protein